MVAFLLELHVYVVASN